MGVICRRLALWRNPTANDRGQMTIELAVAFPVLVIVAVIAVNACTFFYDCAVFDRVSREAVRVYATSPAYGESAGNACASVEQTVKGQLNAPNLDVQVSHAPVDVAFDEYRMTLGYAPTLFGLGLRSEVFGVALPRLEHTTVFVVDSYKPGVVV